MIRSRYITSAVVLFACSLLLPQSCGSITRPEFSQDFSPAQARALVEALAHDSLEGRNTPSRGLDAAARMIAREFKAAGLTAMRENYLHPYILERLRLDTTTSLALRAGGRLIDLRLKDDFVPYGFSAEAKLEDARVVFAGYGIRDEEREYNDYAGLDVRGAVVLIMRGEPSMDDSASSFDGLRLTKRAQLRSKVKTAVDLGAAAVMLVNAPRQSRSLTPRGYDWPVLYPDAGLSRLPYRPQFRSKRSIPVVHVGERVVANLMGSVENLTDLQTEIDSQNAPRSRELAAATVSLDVRLNAETAVVNNVVGVLPGRNPAENIVIGAHYDHVGVFYLGNFTDDAEDEDAELRAEIDSICNGADDNASGTAALIMAARSMAASGEQLQRDVIFVAFSGEERGLYGSQAFVEADSMFDRRTCKAMFNMDMISRNANDSLHLGGGGRSKAMRTWCMDANDAMLNGFTLTEDIEAYYRRSDQWNFAKYAIPSLFFFSGVHDDYHMPSDEVDKLDFDKLSRAAELCTRTAWQAANATEGPDYQIQGDEKVDATGALKQD